MLDEEIAEAGDAKASRHAHALGGAARNTLADLPALHAMGTQLARSLRTVFEPLLRRPVKIGAEALNVARFDEYLAARAPGLAAHMLMTIEPIGGRVIVVADGALIFEMLDLFYGGVGSVPTPLPNEFPPSAEAIVGRAVRGIGEKLSIAWAGIADLAFRPERFEANPAMLSQIEGDERMIVTRYTMALSESRRTSIDILYPVAALKPVAPLLAAKIKGRGGSDPAWLGGLTRAMMDVKLPVRSVLAEPVIPLAQLMNLKAGDIIPISFGPEVPLLVADNRFARGSVGAANGRAAIKVARIEPLQDEDRQ